MRRRSGGITGENGVDEVPAQDFLAIVVNACFDQCRKAKASALQGEPFLKRNQPR